MRKILFNLTPTTDFEHLTHGSNGADTDTFGPDGRNTDSPPTTPDHLITRRPSMEQELNLFRQRSPKIMGSLRPTYSRSPVRRVITPPEEILSENLLKHLSVGSRDSLKLMVGIFEYHQFDKTLLDDYIKNKSPENLKALETQIGSLAVATSAAKVL